MLPENQHVRCNRNLMLAAVSIAVSATILCQSDRRDQPMLTEQGCWQKPLVHSERYRTKEWSMRARIKASKVSGCKRGR